MPSIPEITNVEQAIRYFSYQLFQMLHDAEPEGERTDETEDAYYDAVEEGKDEVAYLFISEHCSPIDLVEEYGTHRSLRLYDSRYKLSFAVGNTADDEVDFWIELLYGILTESDEFFEATTYEKYKHYCEEHTTTVQRDANRAHFADLLGWKEGEQEGEQE
jgi:hypothetical protein